MRSSATGSARRRSGRSRTCSSSASGRARTGPSASGTGPGRTSGPSPSTACSRTSRARSARARPVSPWAVRDRAAGPPCPARRIRRLTTRSASISQAKEIRINEGIRVREVRVVGADGAQLGVMPIQQALETARQQELDLVEVAPEAQPPVCRIMDFGKYKYTQARRLKEARKKQDRKSTRLNSSHDQISYADFCLKKNTRSRLHTFTYRIPLFDHPTIHFPLPILLL